jgi:hypothetical protein
MKIDEPVAPMETTGLLGHLRTKPGTQGLCRSAGKVNERRSGIFPGLGGVGHNGCGLLHKKDGKLCPVMI